MRFFPSEFVLFAALIIIFLFIYLFIFVVKGPAAEATDPPQP
jgi:hypothetical protein